MRTIQASLPFIPEDSLTSDMDEPYTSEYFSKHLYATDLNENSGVAHLGKLQSALDSLRNESDENINNLTDGEYGTAVALFDYVPSTSSELALSQGQAIGTLRTSKGWLLAKDPKTQQEGWVPELYVRRLQSQHDGMSSPSYPQLAARAGLRIVQEEPQSGAPLGNVPTSAVSFEAPGYEPPGVGAPAEPTFDEGSQFYGDSSSLHPIYRPGWYPDADPKNHDLPLFETSIDAEPGAKPDAAGEITPGDLKPENILWFDTSMPFKNKTSRVRKTIALIRVMPANCYIELQNCTIPAGDNFYRPQHCGS